MSDERRPLSQENALVSDLRARLGEEAVAGDGRAFAIAGRVPGCAVFPSSVAQVSEVMAFAGDRSLAVVPCGNATHLHTGTPPRRYDVALSLRRLAQVRAHEAADMTVTVDAGMTLAGLNAELARAKQWLPLDPPLSDRVTVGGLIAADLNGPLRLSQGKVRDLLIGITVVLADGKVAKSGGRVVKNVAGYDLGKLFTGSRGTLAVIVEATFKVRPRPDHMRVVCITAPDLAAAAELGVAVLDTGIAPLFVELLDDVQADDIDAARAPGIAIGLGGIREEVEAQQQLLARHYADRVFVLAEADGVRLAAYLRTFPRPSPSVLTARVSLLPTELAALLPRIKSEARARGLAAALAAHLGNGVARLRVDGGADTRSVLFCEWLRIAVRERGGWVVFDSLPEALHDRVDPFGNPTPAVLLMHGIKRQLDPRGILSPGRFVGGI